MTQLANANLLDDDLANGSSLKNRRLNKVAQKAVNPVPKKQLVVEENLEEEEEEEEYEQEQKATTTTKISRAGADEYEQPKQDYATRKSFYSDQQRYFDEDTKKSDRNSKDDDEKKILGMKPVLFYGLLAVGALVGGYFVFNKFFKGKKGGGDLKPLMSGSEMASVPNPPAPVASSGGTTEIIK